MSKILRTLAVVAAALALPALAGPSWPPAPPRAKVPNPTSKGGFEYVGGDAGWQVSQHKYEFAKGRGFVMSDECDHAKRTPAATAETPKSIDGFEHVGGDSEWQLSPHKYEFAKGRGFVMSDECDHVKRTVKAATPAEIEATQRLSPGA